MGGFADFFKGAGSGLVSGVLGLAGGAVSSITGNKAQEREYERQKEFAQNGIRWKVEDAKAAGIHPLYALGAQTASYSPMSTSGSDYGLSDMGQSIKGAMEAKQTAEERARQREIENYKLGIQELADEYTLEHMKLQNIALRQNIDFAMRNMINSEQAVLNQRNDSIPPMPTTTDGYIQPITTSDGRIVGYGFTPAGKDVLKSPLSTAVLNGYKYFTAPLGGSFGKLSRWDLFKHNTAVKYGIGKWRRPWIPKRDR